MGHLDKARNNLQKDSSKIELQDKQKTIAQEKNKQESQRILSQQKYVELISQLVFFV